MSKRFTRVPVEEKSKRVPVEEKSKRGSIEEKSKRGSIEEKSKRLSIEEKSKSHKHTELLNNYGITNGQIFRIQKIFFDKEWIVAAEEIRKVLRNGEANAQLAYEDEIYKKKIRALIMVYGIETASGALRFEKKYILQE